MKKTLKFRFSRLRAELAIILVAAIVLSMACIANFGVAAATEDLALALKGGPNYTFVGNQNDPQFTVETDGEVTVSSDITKVKLNLKMPDVETLRENMTFGSKGGSATFDKIGYVSSDFAIYFSGTDVTKVGITQKDFYAALDANKTDLAAGKTVTMHFNISGAFVDTGVITGLNIMVSRGSKAAAFDNASFALSNIVFNPTAASDGSVDDDGDSSGDGTGDGTGENIDIPINVLALKDGPDYTFTGSAWYPQLSVELVKECVVKEDFDKIKFDLKMPDIATLRDYMSTGSRGGTSTSEDMNDSYGAGGFAIYFEGTNVKRVGVTQGDFFAALDANKEALAAGETVPMEFDLSGTFVEGGIITGISVMLAHDSAATNFEGKAISLSNMEFPYVISEFPLNLKDAPDYKFVANAWDPQLSVELNNTVKVNENIDKIEFELKLPDVETLMPFMNWGSRGGGATFDEYESYAPDAFALYFTGTNVTRVGVTQGDFYAALDANKEALKAGEAVKLSFDLSGTFVEGGEITGINIMVVHDSDAANFADKPISLSNMMLKLSAANVEMAENQIAIKKGPEYTLIHNEWYPQLNIESKPYALKTTDKFIQIELSISDIDKLLGSFIMGSRFTVGGVYKKSETTGEDEEVKGFSYSGNDLGIWFEGTNVDNIGVTQADLQAVLTKYRVPLFQNQTVTIELPIKVDVNGEKPIPEGASISKLCFMMSHGATAANIAGIKFNIKKITVTEESVVPELEASELTAEDIKSLDEAQTVVDFALKKIYVIAKSTVGNLLNNIEVNESEGFSGSVTWEGSLMANKSKLIEDYDFAYVVAVPNGDDVVFSVIPCNKKAGAIDITDPILNTKDPTGDGDYDSDASNDDSDDDEDVSLEDDYYDDEDYDDGYYEEEIIDGTEQETVIVPSTSGGKNKVVKQTVTENIALYTTPQLIILIAACFLAGAAIMFIIDLIRFKKIALFKKK